MKKFLSKKIVFIIFYIIILLMNLAIPNSINFHNVLANERYDSAIENGTVPEITISQMIDNKSKVDEFDNFLKNSRLLLILVSSVFFIMFLIINTESISISKIFLLISIPIGLLYVFIIPIGGIPDESAHWYKSYEVSLGHFISDKNAENYGGRVLPKVIRSVLTDDDEIGARPVEERSIKMSYKEWKDKYNRAILESNGEEEFIEFSNTSLYSAVCYFPQALGIAVSRIFTSSLLVQSYFARIFNFITYVIIMWYAIKKLPLKKVALFVISFLPITFQEAASLSIDGIQMAFATLLISYTVYLTFDESTQKLKLKDYIILLISSIFTAITKFVYLPICLIIYILPKEKFKSVKIKYIILTTIFIIAVVLDLSLMLKSMNYNNRIALPNADIVGQLKFIYHNPIKFIDVICLTMQDYGMEHTFELFGQHMSWLDVNISTVYIVSLFIITMYLLYFQNTNDEKNVLKNEDSKEDRLRKIITKIFMIIIVCGTAFGIAFTEYLTITPVGHQFIIGTQGRYYLPILILFGIAFSNNLKKEKNTIKIEYLAMFMVFANLNALINIMFRYL